MTDTPARAAEAGEAVVMPTFVLASTIAALGSADVPLPIEMTALVMVGIILRVYISRETRDQVKRDARLTVLEEKVDEQRHLKHEFRTHLTAVYAALSLARQQAKRCTCDAMTPVLEPMDAALRNMAAALAANPPKENP